MMKRLKHILHVQKATHYKTTNQIKIKGCALKYLLKRVNYLKIKKERILNKLTGENPYDDDLEC